MGRLTNKVAVITGGNSGIGACTAELFAKEGAKVVISARRENQLWQVADKIKAAGGEALVVPCDISNQTQCREVMRKTIEAFGTVDILVNNAGVVDAGIEAVEKVTDQTIDTLIDINTKGTLYMAREASKIMIEKQSGSIVLYGLRRRRICGEQGGCDWDDQKYCNAVRFRKCALQRTLPGKRCDAYDNGDVQRGA